MFQELAAGNNLCCADDQHGQNVPLAEPEDDTALSDDILGCSDEEKNNAHLQQCGCIQEKWRNQHGTHNEKTDIPYSVPHNANELYQDEAEFERTLLDRNYCAKDLCGSEVSLEDSESTEACNILNFVQKYYNVHMLGSGHSNAFSKTVSIVSRRSLSVSNDKKSQSFNLNLLTKTFLFH